MRYLITLFMVVALLMPVTALARTHIVIVIPEVIDAATEANFDDLHARISNKVNIHFPGKYDDVLNFSKAPVWSKEGVNYHIFCIDKPDSVTKQQLNTLMQNWISQGVIISGAKVTKTPRQWLINQGYEPLAIGP